MVREESHKKWARKNFEYGKHSARSIPIGYIKATEIWVKLFKLIPLFKDFERIKIVDKVIMPINKCPHCRSKNTFHKRCQKNGDIHDNVWRVEVKDSEEGRVFAKFDYCFACSKEFLIEMFFWRKL